MKLYVCYELNVIYLAVEPVFKKGLHVSSASGGMGFGVLIVIGLKECRKHTVPWGAFWRESLQAKLCLLILTKFFFFKGQLTCIFIGDHVWLCQG